MVTVLKDYLVTAFLPKTNVTGRHKPSGRKACLLCNSSNCTTVRTTATFAWVFCKETFKIQSASLNYNSEKELHPLRCKVCGEAPYVGKAKTKFWYRFNNYKSKHGAFRKGNRNISKKPFHNYYCLHGHIGIDYCLFYFPSLVMYLLFLSP